MIQFEDQGDEKKTIDDGEHQPLVSIELEDATVQRFGTSATGLRSGRGPAGAVAYMQRAYASAPHRIGLCCRNVCYVVCRESEPTLQLLNGISFEAPPGSLTAILGPSGSGKSTLLDCVMGVKQPTSGEVILYEQGSGASGVSPPLYVAQESCFFKRLTVEETLRHSMAIQLPDWTAEQRHEWLQHLLTLLDLVLCKNTRVGVISGGERRRLAVGDELIRMPRVLLLDEPTSGLDSTNAKLLIERLQLFARAGCTMIVTIHQPSSSVFEMFDRIVLMTTKANMCFAGERRRVYDRVLPLFKRGLDMQDGECGRSTPEVLLDGLSLTSAVSGLVSECHQQRTCNENHVPVPPTAYGTRNGLGRDWPTQWPRHTVALARRNLVNQGRDPHVFLTRVAIYGALAVLIVLLFSDLENVVSDMDRRLRCHYYFSSTVVALTIACMPALVEERAVYLRETRNGHYSPGPYVCMLSVANLPYLTMLSLLCTLILYGGIQALNASPTNVAVYFLLLLCVLNCAEANMALVSVQCPTLISALVFGGAITAVNTLFSGFLVRDDELSSPVAKLFNRLMFQRYYFMAVVRNDFVAQTWGVSGTNITMSGDDLLAALDLDSVSIPFAFCVLFLATVLARLLLYAGLKYERPTA